MVVHHVVTNKSFTLAHGATYLISLSLTEKTHQTANDARKYSTSDSFQERALYILAVAS